MAFFLLLVCDSEHGASALVATECCRVACHADLADTTERVARDDVVDYVVAGEEVHGDDDFDFGADAGS